MKNRIRYLFVLMCICILGIIGLQGYWLYDTYRYNYYGFRFNATDALEEATRRMIYENVDKAGSAGVLQPDSLHAMAGQSSRDSSWVRVRAVARRWYARNRPPEGPRPDRDSADPATNRIYRGLLLFWYRQKHTFSPEQLQQVDSLFSEELRLRKISAAYRLDTLHLPEEDRRQAERRDIELPGFPVTTRHVLLNPLDDIWLQAGFKTPVQYILRRMFWLLLATLLLIGCTSYCFGYMLHTILKQKKLSEIKNDFINNMTHELKTPITTVSAAVEALQHFDALRNREKTDAYLSMAEKQLARLSMLVEKVLDTAASEREGLELHREKVDLETLLDEVVNTHQMNASKPVSFQRYYSLSDPVIQADPTHLGNALSNLVDNAVKYSGEQVNIQIRCIRRNGQLVITIKDDGRGIPPAYQREIFEKFFRVPTGNVHTVKGFGLGLSYVKTVVEQHGGQIRVHSEEGKGSEFILTFPEDT
ncbi:HAMP domain-containing sensor histidine kinase [Compostibacter hankyongensis]|uniref:histidine kinase n=1 Tax=Compostibacter hankyongensis TaxID=1007089 RepID=A0ABP8G108_9BACT